MAGTLLPCQLQSSGLPRCHLGPSQRPRQASWRYQSAKRNSTFSAQHSLSSHRAQQRRSCRCEASDSNSKPGLLSGIKNTFRDLWFSKQGRDTEKSIAEPDAQPQPATDMATCSSDTSWQDWAEHMDAMDRRAHQALKVERALALESSLERFDKAAQLKKRLDEIGSVNVVGDLVKEYEQALKDEDYAKAAVLRDEGAVGLTGWWVREDNEDPHGHLLHIAPAFARYVGYAYTAQELAHAAGVPSEDNVDLAQLQQESQSDAVEDFGTPILELFLKRNAQGELHQQGTALKMPDAPTSELNLMFMEVKDGKNGKQAIIPVRQLLEQANRQHALATGSSKPSSSGKTSDSPEVEISKRKHKVMDELVERLPATIAQTSRDSLEVTLHPESFNSGLRRQITTQAEASDDEQDDSDDEYETDSEAEDSEDDEATVALVKSSTGANLDPAKIRQWQERLPADTHSAEQHHLAQMLAAATSDEGTPTLKVVRTEHADGRVEYSLDGVPDSDEDDSDDEEESTSGRIVEVTDGDKKPSWEAVVNNVLEVVKQLKAFAPEPGSSQDQKARHAELIKKLDEAEKSLAPKKEKPAAPTTRRARLQAQLEAQRRRTKKNKATLKALEDTSQMLKSFWQQASQQRGSFELVDDSDDSDDEDEETDSEDEEEQFQKFADTVFETALMMQQSNPRNIIKQPDSSDKSPKTMKYRRLNTDFVGTDPFTGLYLAAFGGQGMEVLQLKREPDDIDDGIEWVTGTKLTGSNVVPTGEISFKAKIGRRGRLGTPDMYPPEMGVIARYKGSGCIAQSNLAQPTWVDGELLHLNGDFGRGAELGFIWSSQQQQSHYLVVLKKIDLSDC